MALQLCRICGNKEGLLDILTQGPSMLEKLSKCANIVIKADDFLPKQICQQCDCMLDMSYQLRTQSETMQVKLQQELNQQANTEVLCISDDEIAKSEFKLQEVKANTGVDIEEEITQFNISNREEFAAIDQESFDAKSESTVLASETEDVIDIDEDLKTTKHDGLDKTQTFRPVSADDIESNESCNDAMANRFTRSITPDKFITEHDVIVDIGNMNDEFIQDGENTGTNAPIRSSLEYCSIDLVSNPGTPTPGIELEEMEMDSRLSSSPYTCVMCNETFTRQKDYHDHIVQHGNNRHQCIQCLAYFSTRDHLVRHEATHIMKSASYNCTHCKAQYSASFNLQRHIKACHSKEGNYHCDICQVSYARQDVLKRHVLQIHLNKKWHCKACGESFRSAYLLNVHKSKPSCTEPSPILSSTKRVHTLAYPLPPEYIVMVADNRYKCIHCNALFKTLTTYKNHLLIHQDIRPFPCPTCPKAFRTRHALVSHQRIHSNEKPFKCDICSKSFRQVTHLKNHRYQHTKDNMPFNCTQCQVGFVTKWKLREHLRKHCTEKAFKCAECPEEFFLKYDLKRHARLIHSRTVDIVDSDNEGNQKNQFTEGTTETDKTDDEIYIGNEMDGNEDIIDIDDDDDDEDYYAESSNSMSGNVLVLNEAEPPSPGDVAFSMENDTNLEREEEAAQTLLTTNNHIHNEDANEPQVHYISFIEDEATSEVESDDVRSSNANENAAIIDFIDLDEEKSTLLAPPSSEHLNLDKSVGLANEAMEVIHLDEEEDELVPLPPQDFNVVAENEPMNDMRYEKDDSKPQILSSMILKSANQETPGLSNDKFINYIHLDSSNSCKSPPRHCNNQFYDDVVEDEEHDEYDTITEEKIQITEEKIETFTSFYNLEDMTES